MTIAMCFVTPEGVVLGADSTASAAFDNGLFHYFNHNQKLFQVGECSSLGILTWGLGSLPDTSYRTLIAKLDDDIKKLKLKTVRQVADRWAASMWAQYNLEFATEVAEVTTLMGKSAHIPTAPPAPHMRSADEEARLAALIGGLFVGFCIGGHLGPDRKPEAYEILFRVDGSAAPVPRAIPRDSFWGAPNLILRLLNGHDAGLRESILASGKWAGTDNELDAILQENALQVPYLPMRDAVDFVYSCIHTTIKALKFSSLNQICGGPIELAVITSDRPFRWVRHKRWDEAILEGDLS